MTACSRYRSQQMEKAEPKSIQITKIIVTEMHTTMATAATAKYTTISLFSIAVNSFSKSWKYAIMTSLMLLQETSQHVWKHTKYPMTHFIVMSQSLRHNVTMVRLSKYDKSLCSLTTKNRMKTMISPNNRCNVKYDKKIYNIISPTLLSPIIFFLTF
jgi:hypothetical protein